MAKPDYLTTNADGSVTIKLARGYDRDGAKVKAATMREPTVGDQIAAQSAGASNAHAEVNLFANLTACTPAEVLSLSMRDYGRLQDAYRGFLD